MGLEGIKLDSGLHLRCNHNQDHRKSSYTSLTTHTLVYQTGTRHLPVSPEHEMVHKFGMSLGPAALPEFRLFSWRAILWLLTEEGYGVAAKT